MADFFDRLDDDHRAFIAAQPIFFVATSPPEGRINLSPKGQDALRVVDAHTVAWVDMTGSGNETSAHLAADGRMTMMWCSFDRKPLILRAYGRGRVLPLDDHGLDVDLPSITGARQVIACDVESVQTSCGYAVPVMDLVEERHTLQKWAANRGPDGLVAYREDNNRRSIDGLASPEPAEHVTADVG